MRMNIYSKIDKKLLIHSVHFVKPLPVSKGMVFRERRDELVAPENFIQCSFLMMNAGKTFRPHKHIWKDGPKTTKAQESWVVIRGRVRVHFYDTDDVLLDCVEIGPGDASFTFHGGHTYEILEDDTCVYEYKSGPYSGQENDKVFIDGR